MEALADLELGRQAHRRQEWGQAFAVLGDLDAHEPLGADDLELLAEAASMLGRGDDEVQLLRRAFLAHAEEGQVGSALRCGYWLCKSLAWAGEFAQAGAWMAKARRLAEADPDCRECGYLLMLDGERHLRAGRDAEMLDGWRTSWSTSPARAGTRDLAAGAAMTLGGALILNGEIESGLTHLDEAMVAVADGRAVGPRDRDDLLRRHRHLSGAVRPAPGQGVVQRSGRMVRGTARVHRRLPRAVPGAPGGDPPARWGMARGGQGGPAGLPAAHRRIRRDGRRRRLLPARRIASPAR